VDFHTHILPKDLPDYSALFGTGNAEGTGEVGGWVSFDHNQDLVKVKGEWVVWCVVWCGVVWCGVVWCGVVWCGVVWCGVVWCGVVWCGVVRCVVRYGVVCDVVRCDNGVGHTF
jgi:hypothetical protein